MNNKTFNKDELEFKVTFEEFRELHKEDNGIDGLLANIKNVVIGEDHMILHLDFKTGAHSKKYESYIYIDFFDPYGSARIRADDGKIFKFAVQNNTTTIFGGVRLSAETIVNCGLLWMNAIHNGEKLLISYKNYCSDVIDGSGTLKSRIRYNRPFNISTSNIQLVLKSENSRRSSHKHIKSRIV